MSKTFRPTFLILALATGFMLPEMRAGSSEQRERLEASFMIAYGRLPSTSEIDLWAKRDASSLPELVASHRKQLETDESGRAATMDRAFRDAFGRPPAPGELDASSGGNDLYFDLMAGHIGRLAEQPSEYEEVIQRAYRFVIRRDAYPEEIDYWSQRETISYVLLVGCVEDWARRNQPGLMVTSGVPTISINCDHLSTVRLSPAVAAEARAAVGLPSAGNGGTHIVAAGAGAVVSGGRIHFALAGASDSGQR